jgi:ATP-dependent Clp protease protease subunit
MLTGRKMVKKSNLNPIFFEKTKDGEMMYDVSSRLVKERTIFIDCPIDSELASSVVSLLFLLDREIEEEGKDDSITLWIKSPGGAITSMFAIYDMMQYISTPIETICIGDASSAAAVLLAAGDKGKRCALPNSRIMIHQVQIHGNGGSFPEIELDHKETKILNDKMIEILARHTGQTMKKVRKDTTMDLSLSAEEALKYGLIDKILSPAKQIPELKK